ncbi:SAM domain-containing protein [Triplophysa tibetana]|uniref:SAM domain-containing protein n=1 Tax=Triplophysa tibetana TaxID=1572043 RepID=A0A5A9MW12_9TELE|nr:SAM domain-containing protein [Triplophysa tibetana]
MDSLYEAVQESCDAQVYTIPCRSCSPAVPLHDNNKWRNTGRCISMTETANREIMPLNGTRFKKVDRKLNQRGTPTQDKAGAKGMVPLLLDVGAQVHTLENSVGSRVMETALSRKRWSNPAETPLTWAQAYPSGQSVENRIHSSNSTTSKSPSQGHQLSVQTIKRDPSPKVVVRSPTNVDFCASNRSTSFGRFDTLRNQQSPSKLQENGTTEEESESTAENCEKPGSLGKKMKAISMTMRKKMGKKNIKSYSEYIVDDTEGEAENGFPVEKSSDQTRNSSESLCSGRSSSSGVVSNSDVSSNRDSLKLEEEVTYTGQFCGRAKVHTDFVPSPYDTDSLKLKVGDIINIISKPPMGIWTGLLSNKVGNFKFIYVDVIPEKEKEDEEEKAPKIRPVKVCKKPRPNTLLELLEQLHLEEYASSLLLNGYQTVDDLKHLKEKHLIELNVTDPDHRHRLLAASDCLYVTSRDEQEEMKGEEEDEANDCLRDSGCFIPAECSDS